MAINKKSGDVLEFSNFTEYLSHTNCNGILRLWDTNSAVLRQEYVSIDHLAAKCHCLSWCPTLISHPTNETPNKKRKRSSRHDSIDNLQLVALGTSAGSILLYSAKKGDLHKTLSGGHAESVMDVCWSEKGDRLFSCSRDGNVVCWDVEGACVESKWKTDTGLSSICLCSSQKHLLTAGRVIQVWDLDSKISIQSFQGHTTDVLKLLEIPPILNKMMNGNGAGHEDDEDDEKLKGLEESFVLSMAADENKISLRQIGRSSKELLASFALPDQPVYFDVSTRQDQTFQMIVVTRGGSMAYFECHLNGRHRKPMKPKIVTCITTGNNKGSRSLPILVAKLLRGGGGGGGDGSMDGEAVVCVLYGDVLKPAFDRINVKDLKESLVREDPRSCKVSVEESVVKIKTPTVANDLMLLSSACVQASRRDGNDEVAKPSRKRKKSFSQSQDEITLGDQLSQMTKQQPTENHVKPSSKATSTTSLTTTSSLFTITKPSLATTYTPSSAKIDSLAILLGQGLQSGDKKILNNVLQKSEQLVIRATVAKLPSQCIQPLVRELSRRISGHAQSGKSAIRWMKALLSIHSSYLTTVPDIEELLNPLVDLLEPSLEVMLKMMVLKGKLDCMAVQFSVLSAPTSNQATHSKPALSTIHPVDEEDDDFMAEDVRHLEISDEDEWEDETETVAIPSKDYNSSNKTSDFSDGEGSGDDTLMEAD